MNRMLALALVLTFTVALVSGCSTHHAVEQRAFSAEESHQLALEDLNRRGLSFDEYQARKAQLMADPQIQQVRDFDEKGETNVDLGAVVQQPQG
ncbi:MULTISPECIES: hypothetical protein [Pseudomonas syringae group]|uniref:Lipoprotein n=1 Tax=Pseudomonas syringae pv. coryli TaxID=317659 RepID=A0A0P9NYM9_9PSED|nr:MULTISPECIES: hypothetical protein [Pseudomonas syringae group]AZG87202.1 hypothetical protein N032_16890 [Pseudomonas syringae pv. pisi str. PP1]KPX04704.1 Lipoprotein [Pseudomonas syringae pv. coryli]POP72542.1 hypothetical protein CXB37_26960 [Pseudomonas syringae pv. syringae]QQQ48806.1 hypothetical protein JJQ97_15675 [Pseudomonas syringae]RMM25118.1 Lipoprotein [Pseudomonas syringae pv. pisi]